jgi:hypothetical protein
VGTNEAERDSQIRFTSERHSVCEGKYTVVSGQWSVVSEQ